MHLSSVRTMHFGGLFRAGDVCGLSYKASDQSSLNHRELNSLPYIRTQVLVMSDPAQDGSLVETFSSLCVSSHGSRWRYYLPEDCTAQYDHELLWHCGAR